MKRHLFFLATLAAFATSSQAQTPTWADDIAPILYAKCTSCHHTGGLAPNALITYSQAFNYANLINSNVQNGIMPPWPPDHTYKSLAFQRILTTTEKTKIMNWVTGGAPQGNINNAPTPPTYTNNASQLSSIDFSAKMPDYTVNTSQDLYRAFVLPTNFAVDKFAAEVEVKPGNSSIVHHVLVFEDTNAVILQNDLNDPGPGYTSFFGTGSSTSRLVGEWVPGTAPIKFPAGMGVRLKANTRIILQIHYPGGTFGILDSTRVNIKFAPGSPREVYIAPMLSESNITNPPFTIPANTVKTFTQQYNNPYPIAFTMLSIAPHMHLVGTKYKVYATGPSNDTIPLINIPKWDFKWQGVYSFPNPIKFPAGYKIMGYTEYDNTSSNPSNPNTPPLQVSQGENTTDEMMQTYFAFLAYQSGDENIVVDGTITGLQSNSNSDIVKSLQLYEIYPNPTKGTSKLPYFSPDVINSKAKIYSQEGKLVKEWDLRLNSGFGDLDLPTEGLARGQYYVTLQVNNYFRTRTFIVSE
jgi:hypothetical protein